MAGQWQWWQHRNDSGSTAMTVAVWWQCDGSGGGGSSVAAAVAAVEAVATVWRWRPAWQLDSRAASLEAALWREAWTAQRWRRQQHGGSEGQCVGSAMEAGIAAAAAPTAVLPPVEENISTLC